MSLHRAAIAAFLCSTAIGAVLGPPAVAWALSCAEEWRHEIWLLELEHFESSGSDADAMKERMRWAEEASLQNGESGEFFFGYEDQPVLLWCRI